MATLLKLVNGEEVIGEIENIVNEQYIVRDPLLVELTSDGLGTHGMILVNYCPFSEVNTVEIDVKNVVSKYVVNNSLQEYYEKSIIYCRKYHDIRFVKSISTAISYLDNIIEKLNDKDQPKKKKIDLKIVSSYTSNTVN